MESLRLLARLQLRRRWRSLVFVALVIAVVGGVSASLIAGSRRSASVVGRYFGARTHYDLNVYTPTLQPSRKQILGMPGVRRADPAPYLAMNRRAPDGTESESINGTAADLATGDPTTRILRGRVPDRSDMFGVLVNEGFVKQFGLGVGDTVDVRMYSDADRDNMGKGVYQPTGPRYRFHLTGVFRSGDDFVFDESRGVPGRPTEHGNVMVVPFRFYERYAGAFANYGNDFDVQLADPKRDRPRFVAAVKAASARAGVDSPPGFQPPSGSERRASFDTPVNLESSLLLALGVAFAIAGVVVVALLLRAEQRSHRGDEPTLHALGFARSQLGIVAAMRTVPVATVGAILVVVVAFVLSGRYPIGIGRQIELHPGTEANVAVLGGAAATTFVAVVGFAFVFGRRGSRRARHPSNPAAARWLARVGAPVHTVVGAQLAFEREPTSGSMPSRGAVTGGAVALAVVAAVGVFIGGTNDLYGSPSAHGWPWDVAIGNQNFDFTGARSATLKRLVADPRIRARTRASFGQATIGGRSLEVLAIDPAGTAPPVILSGRLPRATDEIAIGAKLGRELDARVGSRVRFSIAGGDFERKGRRPRDVDAKVVGIALPPILGESELGESGIVTTGAIEAAGGHTPWRFLLARVAGSNRSRAVASLSKSYTQEMKTDVIPSRVVNLRRVRPLPLLAALLAAALGIILLCSTMAVGVRVRTRQLAVLRALGMPARQLRRVIAYQGVALAVVICLVGLPLGVVVGSVAWRSIADQLGVGDRVSGALWAALLVPITILVGLAASIIPGRRVRRQDAASLLRAE
ncbi:MAG: FtsX-like permease family protein [Acidimicrobiia bacterium]